MSLRAYLRTLIFSAIVAWAVFVVSFFTEVHLYLRYSALFLGLSSVWSLLEFIFRARQRKGPLFLQISVSFRHSIWLAILVVGLLLLREFKIFYLPNIILLVLVLGLLEIFFRMSDKRYKEF